jgi:dTDP-4-amino-4,6-dideoxygalactose transaminase
MKIPFSPPYIDQDVKDEVLKTLESGWITSGPKVQELENLVSEKYGLSHTVCCNSATSGLLLMLHWYGVTKGDEVIIPAYTYAATALVVMHVGATPVMVDVVDDFNINVTEIGKKITEKTKVIIPVDIAGWPCNYDAINNLVNSAEVRSKFRPAGEHQQKLGRILVLADSAHSIGALYKQSPAAHFADISVFSFHAVKNVTTAEGGAICINLPQEKFDHANVYKQLRLWTLNGQTKDALTKTQGGGWRYDIVYPGFKMNMPDICAAIGVAQLKKYDSLLLRERRRVFESYTDMFKPFGWAQLPAGEDATRRSSYHLYALRIRGIGESQRDAIIDRINAEGVQVNVHFQPLPLLKIFKDRGFKISDFPVAFDNYSREISLPIYPELDLQKIQYIVKAVVKAYENTIEAVSVHEKGF